MRIEEAKTLLKKNWGIDGEISTLPSERDINFKISGKANYVLKIYSKVDKTLKTSLNLQNKVLKFLEEKKIHTTPFVVPARSKKLLINPNKNSVARVLTFHQGSTWGGKNEHSGEQIEHLGRLIATVDKHLSHLKMTKEEQKSLNAPFIWNMLQAESLLTWSSKISDSKSRKIVEATLNNYKKSVLPKLKKMPMQIIHNDGNDYNIIENGEELSLIDFGDMIYAPKVVGAAVAAAYVGLKSDDPVKQISQFVRGYHSVYPLSLEEISIFIELVKVRLASSVANAALQRANNPDNDYLSISQNDVPKCLEALDKFDSNFALFRLRNAIGLEANPNAKPIRDYLLSIKPANLLEKSFADLKRVYINWSFDNQEIPRSTKAIEDLMSKTGAQVTIGYYCENRNVYQGEAFNPAAASARTFHLGVDVGMPAGTPIYAPLDAVIEIFNNNSTHLDYGPVVILRHKTDQGVPFWTLYGHLSIDSMPDWKIGKEIKAGGLIGRMGKEEENVGWPPHTHFQLLTDLCGMGIDIYGVAPRDEVALWRGISLNPNLVLGIESGTDAHAKISPASIRSDRRVVISQNLSLNFKNPINIVSGSGAYLFDEKGKSYLDLVNNVAHVGHCHPRVVAAAASQMSLLNTNTRYLHQSIVEYGKAITSTMPDPLSVIFFVNSGSEANDLAIRLARAHTKSKGVVALRHGYHGHTQAVVEISPYKFLGKGGEGAPSHVAVAELPDLFRGKFTGKGATEKYISNLKKSISSLKQPISAFFAESIVSTAGQIVLPPGYLAAAFKLVRSAGGLCVSDEVQIGMGRVGDKFWGFELHDVVPDIVTLGKPLGNGHPLAAVVTTPEVAASFNNGMEYFNTFGGNPVSAAIGQAVLEVVYDQRLQLNAKNMGQYLRDGVNSLAKDHSIIADVRGSGLFIGVEMMRDKKIPATKEVADLMEFALSKGVLLSCDGPDNNVLKIKPPLIINKSDVDLLLNVFSDWLGKKMKPPLTGIKIADFSRVLAGPYATMLLADLGAQVVKVERAGVGDDTRGWGPPFDKDGNSTYFLSVNRNKESLELDLTKESDQKAAVDLINSCDVVVENFGPGGMEKYNLGYSRLIGNNPKLIYCAISGFGTSEKGASLPGYDLLLQGMSGLMSITGSDVSNPSKVGVALVDVITGLHAVVGILAALRARDEQGIGQKVELNLLSSTLSALVNQASAYISAGVIPKAMGNAHPSIAPYQVFDAKDKKFIVAVGSDLQFIKFAGVISPDLIGDKRFATNQLRVQNRDQLNSKLAEIFATNTADHWITTLGKVNIPVGAINNIKEAFDLAQSLGLNSVVEVDGVKSVANPITFSKTPVEYRLAPPNLKG